MNDQASMQRRPLPTLTELNRPFWEGGLSGQLRLQRCAACGHLRYPISMVCPRCLASDADWEPVSGEGTVLSYATFHRAYHPAWQDRIPYTVALVELREGPRMIVDLLGDDVAEVRVGDRVVVEFEVVEGAGLAIPHFRLARATQLP